MRFVFWTALALTLYTHVGYPALVMFAGRLLRRRIAKGPCEPRVTVIIAAHNEARRIAATVENKLRLDYAAAKLQIIVVSDASSDGTDAVARAAGKGRVLVLRQESRRGKTAALNRAVQHATGSILVFSDANSMYAEDALRKLVRNFRDARVGYVTGRLCYEGGTAIALGCRVYMAYEDLLRRSETNVGSIVGANGGIDAVRRDLYKPMRDEELPDFVLPFHVVRRGYRAVYEPDATMREDSLVTGRAEYRMRVRVALRAWWTFADMASLFNVRRHGVFVLQLVSHKVLRYLAFAALPVLYGAAFALRSEAPLYGAVFAAGSVFLALAAAGYVMERVGGSIRVLTIPYYVLLINAAAAHALFSFLRGRRQAVWSPRLG